MLHRILKSFRLSGPATTENESISVIDDDIPRYPPFAKGIPAVGADRIIRSQSDLIRKARGILRFDDKDFMEIVQPVIERYAAYVHLLPASEGHHHRGAGGLFRHGLEVAVWAAQGSEAYQFCTHDTPTEKALNEPRWQFAAFLGGLCHDVGKPLSDVAVVDKTGKKEWNPYESSLSAWSIQEGVSNYYLRWRPKRNRRHEKFSMMNLDQILTPASKRYLNLSGPIIMEALLEAIVGTGASEPLTKLVLWADSESVSRDLRAQRLDVDEYQYGVPVERFIFDAIRRSVGVSGNVNIKGGYIWRLEDAVYINWAPMVERIHALLAKDKIPGVPKDPDVLADILIERGFAVPKATGNGADQRTYRYWVIFPELLSGMPVTCLRFDELDLIFNNEPPTPVPAFHSKVEYEKFVSSTLIEEKAEIVDESLPNNSDIVSWEEVSKETEHSDETQTHSGRHSAISDQSATPVTAAWLLIEMLMNEYKLDKKSIEIKNGLVAIAHPEVTSKIGEPKQVMNSFAAEKMLDTDPLTSAKTHKFGEKRYLILTNTISTKVRALMHNIDHDSRSAATDIDTVFEDVVKSYQAEFIQQLQQGEGNLLVGPVERRETDDGEVLSILLDSQAITRLSNKFGRSREFVEEFLKHFTEFQGVEDTHLGKSAAKRINYFIKNSRSA